MEPVLLAAASAVRFDRLVQFTCQHGPGHKATAMAAETRRAFDTDKMNKNIGGRFQLLLTESVRNVRASRSHVRAYGLSTAPFKLVYQLQAVYSLANGTQSAGTGPLPAQSEEDAPAPAKHPELVNIIALVTEIRRDMSKLNLAGELRSQTISSSREVPADHLCKHGKA